MQAFLPYLALCAGTALLLSTLLVLLAGAVARRSMLGWWPLAAITLFFLALTHLPFPDRATMACPTPYTEPQLLPLRPLVAAASQIWPQYFASSAEMADLLASPKFLLSTAANLVICLLIGAALSRHTASLAVAFAVGLALSLLVELSQLTGMFGLFPCPWRQFDVDDLILNVTGVVAGLAAARGVRSLRRRG